MSRYKCFRCHKRLNEKRWICTSCKHGYCKDCFLTYHWHTPEQNFGTGGAYGGARIRT